MNYGEAEEHNQKYRVIWIWLESATSWALIPCPGLKGCRVRAHTGEQEQGTAQRALPSSAQRRVSVSPSLMPGLIPGRSVELLHF